MGDNTAIPTTIITGFLGAGKTSYINKLIQNNQLAKDSVIIVNDFGSINIDCDLIDYSDDKIIKMNNGCICCTLGTSLAEQLNKILTLQDNISQLYIETSGVGDPKPINGIININSKFKLSLIICLIDGSQCLKNSNDNMIKDIWYKQIQNSHSILINRTEKNNTQVLAMLNKINPTAQINIDDNLPDSNKVSHKVIDTSPSMRNGDFKTLVKSFSVQFNKNINKQSIDKLLTEYKDCLLRAKGCIKLDTGETQIVQLSGNSITWWASLNNQNQLLCIGYDGDELRQLKNKITKL